MATPSTSTNDSSPLEPPVKIPDLWFSDGDVVLRAGNSVFKLKGEDLASTCRVFRDMLSVGQSASTGDFIEALPVILLEEPPKEMEYFFMALFHPGYLNPPPTKSDYIVAFAVLRMAHKYGNHQLRYRALQHLSTAFPTTLIAYDSVEQSRTVKPSYPADLFLAVNVIIETGELWLLPYAYYQVVHGCSIEKIYSGSRIHGTEDTLQLHEESKLACLRAYLPNLLSLRDVLSFLSPLHHHSSCSQRDRCNMVRFVYLNQVRTLERTNHSWARHPLGGWLPLSTGFYKDVCVSCRRDCEESYRAARQKFWNALPGMFGMERGWEELERMKQERLHGEEFIHDQLNHNRN